MKTRILIAIAALLLAAPAVRAAGDSLGLAGDNLDLAGVLELFKKAKSPEDFEKSLNAKDNKVNNLDLNADGKVDYLRVVDISDKGTHSLVLRDPVSQKESQDVAVIAIEKQGTESARLQIIGDEVLYGKDYVVEPKSDKDNGTEGKWQGYAPQVVFVDVWYWPCVQYIWYPGYVVYVSPWYWGYWPGWWYPWEPYPYVVYYGWWYPYHVHYVYVQEVYVTNANSVYQPRREVSSTVYHREEPKLQQHEARRQEAIKARDGNAPVDKPRDNNAPRNVPPANTGETRDKTQTPPDQQRGGNTGTPPPPQQRDNTGTPPPPQQRDNTGTPPPPQQKEPRTQPAPQPKAPRGGGVHPAPAPRPAPSPRPAPTPRRPR